MDKFDEAVEGYKNTFTDGVSTGQKIILNALLDEVKTYQYNSISDLLGAIHGHLEQM